METKEESLKGKSQVFIVEHLEKRMWRWCIIEYKHISEIVGRENFWITNARKSKELSKYGKIIRESVSELQLNNACVLDPEAEKTLSPEEAGKFDYFIFGGILGDNPPRKRTKQELTAKIKNAEARNIGKNQMSTDNAVYVVSEIVKGKKISEIEFQEGVEIKINDIESTILPYRYAKANGKPLISEELVRYLKRKKTL